MKGGPRIEGLAAKLVNPNLSLNPIWGLGFRASFGLWYMGILLRYLATPYSICSKGDFT